MAKDKVRFTIGEALAIPNEGKCLVKNIHKNGDSAFIEFKKLYNNETLIKSIESLTKEVLERRQTRLHTPIKFNTPSEAYWFSVGFLAMYGTVTLRTTPSTVNILPNEYFLVTRCEPDQNYVEYNPNLDTYADNASITFKRPTDEVFEALAFPENEVGNTMLQTSKNRYIIYNKNFIWALFAIGLKTGSNHDINKMRAYIKDRPVEYTQAFNKGYMS